MKVQTRKKGVSETIPITLNETFNIKNGAGRVVERWTVKDIGAAFERPCGFKGRYIYFEIEYAGGIHG